MGASQRDREKTDRRSLSRRRLFQIGAATVAGSWMSPLRSLAGAGRDERLPLAFVSDSDALEQLDELSAVLLGGSGVTATPLEGAFADPASWRSIGDPTLAASPLRITIDPLPGLHRAISRSSFDRALLRVWTPPSAENGGVPFRAWSYERSPVRNEGAGVHFVHPSGIRGELLLTLDLEESGNRRGRPVIGGDRGAEAGPSLRLTSRLTTGVADGEPKLQRGLYLIAMLPGLLRRSQALEDLSGSRFPGLLLAVERAEQPSPQ